MIPQVMFKKTYFFFSLYTFRGNSTQELAILIFGSTQESVLAAANTAKLRERYWKNAGEWTERVEISMEEIPGS